jgi:hypothetical protein
MNSRSGFEFYNLCFILQRYVNFQRNENSRDTAGGGDNSKFFVSKKIIFDKQITDTLRERLYKLYKDDFELFGYDENIFY